MRASFMLLGPLLARFGRVIISNPGGDRIGRRPVNLHVDAMRDPRRPDRVPQRLLLRDGARAGCAARRSASRSCRSWAPRTRCSPPPWPRATRSSDPAAQEPEVDDLIAFLQKMGADVERTYPDTIEIEGKKRLRGAEHRVIPDRIEAGTFVVAGAVTGGQITLTGAPCEHLGAFVETMGRAGVGVVLRQGHDRGRRDGARRRRASSAVDIETARRTQGWPRTSSRRPRCCSPRRRARRNVHETIFEDRLEWMSELRRMGADDRHPRQPPRRDHGSQRSSTAPRSRSATCAPAPR